LVCVRLLSHLGPFLTARGHLAILDLRLGAALRLFRLALRLCRLWVSSLSQLREADQHTKRDLAHILVLQVDQDSLARTPGLSGSDLSSSAGARVARLGADYDICDIHDAGGYVIDWLIGVKVKLWVVARVGVCYLGVLLPERFGLLRRSFLVWMAEECG
jgi:hypothetical protein